MAMRRKQFAPGEKEKILAEFQRSQAARPTGYREQALAILPHVCGKCGREFSGKQISELTVHHKDNDHMNNPPDGGNWELLCIYCHDDAHEAYERLGYQQGTTVYSGEGSSSGFRPFEGLEKLIKPKGEESDSG